MSKDPLSYTLLKEVGFRLLSEGTSIKVRAEGYSMYPSIKPGSIVFIESFTDDSQPVPGEIIAWKKESGFVVHRLFRIEEIDNKKYFITRGDSIPAEDDPVPFERIAGKVVKVEKPEGKPVSPEKYLNSKPNYSLNRFLVRIISQISRVKRIFST
ncbi:MAG: signal peptidase I [Bacteroidota bacterium]|nr:signal peptidase I [Bacteroidota bacterium]